MKKYLVGLCAVLVFIATVVFIIEKAKAETTTSKTLCIPNNPDFGFSDITNAYAVITDIRTGDIFHKTTGAISTTWADCAIEFTKDAQNTDWAIATMPGLPNEKEYAIIIYENASPTLGDTIKVPAIRYDPVHGITFTDSSPVIGGRTRTIEN
jgi:hypothetical protein